MRNLAEEILELVRVPSPTGQERALADLLEARLCACSDATGNRLLRLHNTLVYGPAHLMAGSRSTEAAPSRPLVLIAGHIDTVPQADAPEPAMHGTRITGRGAVDMKAGLAVLLRLAETLPAGAGFADRVFILYEGEEGSEEENGLRRVLETCGWMRNAGLALLLEPSGGALELGCKGSIHLEVAFRGQSCHSARPWLGRHPLHDAIPWMQSILDLPIRDAEVGGVVFREVVTLTTLAAGVVRNTVPDTMRVNMNLRYAPDRGPDDALACALSLLPEGCAVQGHPGMPGDAAGSEIAPGAEAVLIGHSRAGEVRVDAPLMRRLIRYTGLPRRAKQGWTDVARFTAAGIPAVNWGPGDSGLCHTAGEFADAAEAEDCLEMMRRFLLHENWGDDGSGSDIPLTGGSRT